MYQWIKSIILRESDGECFPTKASAIKPGDIVTEIKMTVGQNSDGGGRSRAADGPKVFNGGGGAGRRLGLPPPKVVSSSPSPNGADGDGLLLGMSN